ncbi:hypothetical protein NliqN6_2274 [Naganishia liquefaciens]|uniref:D-glycerate dehydrogenase n=1 Tax=Naganishia liquefaciens TaxID=104408 RepID=A0A8H3YF43_9TREE|nr:hypothetical protein NliqN6_2274 [Naganishia liquefaciens]
MAVMAHEGQAGPIDAEGAVVCTLRPSCSATFRIRHTRQGNYKSTPGLEYSPDSSARLMASPSSGSPAKGKIVVCRDMGKEAMGILKHSGYELVVWPETTPPPRSWVLDNVKDAAGICVMMADRVDDELLDAAGPNLKVVSTFSVGYDHFDTMAIKARNIRAGHTPGVLNDAVADTAVLLVLMAMRRAGEAIKLVQDGQWPQTPWSPFLLTGPALSRASLTIGFLGFGRISQCTLHRLLAFTQPPTSATPLPRCIYTSSRARSNQGEIDQEHTRKFGVEVTRVEAQVLAAQSDVLIVLCSLNESTKGMVNEAFLNLMKRDSVLINVARGPIVDSDALANALRDSKIFAAGLDVIAGEPNIPADHPLVLEPKCVVLPHIGSADRESRNGMAVLCARNVVAGVEGAAMPAELSL